MYLVTNVRARSRATARWGKHYINNYSNKITNKLQTSKITLIITPTNLQTKLQTSKLTLILTPNVRARSRAAARWGAPGVQAPRRSCVCVYVCIYIYIYIYRERQIYVCMYIYIYREREIHTQIDKHNDMIILFGSFVFVCVCVQCQFIIFSSASAFRATGDGCRQSGQQLAVSSQQQAASSL